MAGFSHPSHAPGPRNCLAKARQRRVAGWHLNRNRKRDQIILPEPGFAVGVLDRFEHACFEGIHGLVRHARVPAWQSREKTFGVLAGKFWFPFFHSTFLQRFILGAGHAGVFLVHNALLLIHLNTLTGTGPVSVQAASANAARVYSAIAFLCMSVPITCRNR
ncbi:protein of unknown function [Burkholderia multivorans]